MDVLVMDLERNIKLLGTPERAQVGHLAGTCTRPAPVRSLHISQERFCDQPASR